MPAGERVDYRMGSSKRLASTQVPAYPRKTGRIGHWLGLGKETRDAIYLSKHISIDVELEAPTIGTTYIPSAAGDPPSPPNDHNMLATFQPSIFTLNSFVCRTYQLNQQEVEVGLNKSQTMPAGGMPKRWGKVLT